VDIFSLHPQYILIQIKGAYMLEDIDLDTLESMVWGLFTRSLRDHKRGFHYLNIGTIDEEGSPTIRTVILRQASQEKYMLSFHTDARSRKYKQLQANPVLAIHAYDRKSNLQVSIRATATLHHLNKEAEVLYQTLGQGARALYSKNPAPMTTINHPSEGHNKEGQPDLGFENFVWIDAKIQTMEVLQLGRDMHRKMIISVVSGLSKYWVVP